MPKIVEVRHSESKPAWNIVGKVPGGKYKWARMPYLLTGQEILDTQSKYQALRLAQFIAKKINEEYQ